MLANPHKNVFDAAMTFVGLSALCLVLSETKLPSTFQRESDIQTQVVNPLQKPVTPIPFPVGESSLATLPVVESIAR